jgi:hypothetical protein
VGAARGGGQQHARALLGVAILFSTLVQAVRAAPPTAAITAPSHPSPSNESPIDLVVTFSEKVSVGSDTTTFLTTSFTTLTCSQSTS